LIKSYFLHNHFNDLEVLVESARAWQVDIIQLDKGTTDCDLLHVVSEQLILNFISFNRTIRLFGAPPSANWTFVLLSPVSSPWIWGGREISSQTIVVYQPGTDFDCVCMPGYKSFSFSMAPEVFERLCNDLKMPHLINKLINQKLVKCSQAKTSSLWDHAITYIQAFRGLSNEQRETEGFWEKKDELLKDLLIGLAEGISVTRKTKDDKINRIIKSVDEYLATNPFSLMTVRELCQIAQIRERSLQYSFRSLFGITPRGYLKAINLNRVKKELYKSRAEDVLISDVANKWGFWHMGQFAADYRQLFGEMPSETLATKGNK